jgi:hypothetical protein
MTFHVVFSPFNYTDLGAPGPSAADVIVFHDQLLQDGTRWMTRLEAVSSSTPRVAPLEATAPSTRTETAPARSFCGFDEDKG